MALASYPEARTPVELSLSPVFHYQYSSIHKALHYLAADSQKRSMLQKDIQELCMSYFQSAASPAYYLLATDTTPQCKPHSPSLKERTYIATPNNVIAGNKPLNIGYETSFINISDGNKAWSLPLSIRRVAFTQTASECALQQLEELFEHPTLGFKEHLVVNTLDSKYGNPHYLAPAHQHDQLVNVVRLRSGMKVWKQNIRTDTGGAPGIYGEKYYLHAESQYKSYKHPKTKESYQVFQQSIFELPADETLRFCTQTSKGRKLLVELWRWNNLMFRTKNGHNMKDKPFDLIAVNVFDAQSGKRIFDREMFIAITGKHKDTLSIYQGYEFYRRRYDIEPYLRFAKQRLMFNNYQTPDTEHLDSWLWVIQLASWLLYTASEETRYQPRKWEQYLPKNKQVKLGERLSISQTRKSIQNLFLTFDPEPFKPIKCKKGKGRKFGQRFQPRKRYPVLKKTKSKHQIEKIE